MSLEGRPLTPAQVLERINEHFHQEFHSLQETEYLRGDVLWAGNCERLGRCLGFCVVTRENIIVMSYLPETRLWRRRAQATMQWRDVTTGKHSPGYIFLPPQSALSRKELASRQVFTKPINHLIDIRYSEHMVEWQQKKMMFAYLHTIFAGANGHTPLGMILFDHLEGKLLYHLLGDHLSRHDPITAEDVASLINGLQQVMEYGLMTVDEYEAEKQALLARVSSSAISHLTVPRV